MAGSKGMVVELQGFKVAVDDIQGLKVVGHNSHTERGGESV